MALALICSATHRSAAVSVRRPLLRRRVLRALCLSALWGCQAQQPTPPGKDRLSVSAGGHYLRYGGKPLLLVGDSGTQCVLQDLNLDYRQWLDDCAGRGLTAVHLWALVAPRQTQDGSVLEARYGYVYPGVTPWARRNGGPPAVDGGPHWDLTRFDEGEDPDKHYWPRLRDLCRRAGERGLVVGITAFFGWPKHNTSSRPDWLYHPLNARNGGFLTEPAPMTTVCQTIDSPGREVLREPWEDNWPVSKKTQWVWERYAAKLIRDTQPFGNVFYVFMDEHSYTEGNCGDHFLEFFRKRGAVYTDWEQRRDRVALVHNDARAASGDGNAEAVRAFYRTPTRPNLTLEAPPYQGDILRRSIWSRVIAGHHVIFHNDEGQETRQTGIMVYDPNVCGGRRDMVLRRLDWLGHASRFFNETILDLDAMAPHNGLIKAPEPAYCLADPGNEYAVYSWRGEAFDLDLSAAVGKKLTARFYSPRDGQWCEPLPAGPGGRVTFRKPDASDWVLHVRASE